MASRLNAIVLWIIHLQMKFCAKQLKNTDAWVTTDCQVDKIYTHLENESLSIICDSFWVWLI